MKELVFHGLLSAPLERWPDKVGVCDGAYRATFAEHFMRHIDPVRRDLPLRHVVVIGDVDVAHDHRYDELLVVGEPVAPPSPVKRTRHC